MRGARFLVWVVARVLVGARVLAGAAFLAGCGLLLDAAPPDPPLPGGRDAGMDAGHNGGLDGGPIDGDVAPKPDAGGADSGNADSGDSVPDGGMEGECTSDTATDACNDGNPCTNDAYCRATRECRWSPARGIPCVFSRGGGRLTGSCNEEGLCCLFGGGECVRLCDPYRPEGCPHGTFCCPPPESGDVGICLMGCMR
jgi:hypothetical protein